MTSESRIRRHTIFLPLSERRSTPRLRWLRPLRRKKTLTPFRYASAPDQCRSQAPLVGSILTTSAPRSARICTAEGPCRKCVKLRTFTRFNNVYPVLSVSGRQTMANKSLYLDLITRPGGPFETRLALFEEGPGPSAQSSVLKAWSLSSSVSITDSSRPEYSGSLTPRLIAATGLIHSHHPGSHSERAGRR